MMDWRVLVKSRLVALPLPQTCFYRKLDGISQFSKWIRDHRLRELPYFKDRKELYRHIHSRLNGGPVTYLEFGVFEGESMRAWTGLNTHPGSRFEGFDSFEGLPECWKQVGGGMPASAFSTEGRVPDLADPRVSWHKGWFQDTLPDFLDDCEFSGPLIVHMDADLYSSTLYVLSRLEPLLSSSIMLFDEFSSVADEFRAVQDFCSAFRRKYRVLASAGEAYDKVAMEWL